MYKLIQVKISHQVVKKLRGEITEDNLRAYIDGANVALGFKNCHFEYSLKTDKNYGIVEGMTPVPAIERSKEDYKFFLNGYSLVMNELEAYGEDVSVLEDFFAEL